MSQQMTMLCKDRPPVARRFGRRDWALTTLGLLIITASLMGLPPYLETGSPGDPVVWWLGRGEFGRMRSLQLPRSQLRGVPMQIHAVQGNDVHSMYLPLDLYDFRLLGLQFYERQSLRRDGQSLEQTLWVRVPLWIVGAMILTLPTIKAGRIWLARKQTASTPFGEGRCDV